MKTLLTAKDIRYSFNDEPLLKDININLIQNTLNILSGENGSGKTTLLKILSTLLTPNSGTLLMFDEPLTHQRHQRRQIGLSFAEPSLISQLSVSENLNFFSSFYDASSNTFHELIHFFKLGALLDRKIQDLSRGEKQKINLIRSLVQKPTLVLWDEPESGLDTQSTQLLLSLIEQLMPTTTFLIASHQTHLFAPLPHTLHKLHRGRLT